MEIQSVDVNGDDGDEECCKDNIWCEACEGT